MSEKCEVCKGEKVVSMWDADVDPMRSLEEFPCPDCGGSGKKKDCKPRQEPAIS